MNKPNKSIISLPRKLSHRYGFLVLLMLISTSALGFECNKASTDVEKIVCKSPRLIWDDRSLNALYRLARIIDPSYKKIVERDQRKWLNDTRNQCKTEECLLVVYKARSDALTRFVNSIADSIPTASQWRMSYTPNPNPDPENCSDTFEVGFVRQPENQVIGVWEASTFCHGYINGGMVDAQEDGRILNIRILGGRGPSYQVGVALIAHKRSHLYIANMFERSSVGMQGDTEFFSDVVLTGGKVKDITIPNEYGDISVASLKSAWAETESAAKSKGICVAGEDINVCDRRIRP